MTTLSLRPETPEDRPLLRSVLEGGGAAELLAGLAPDQREAMLDLQLRAREHSWRVARPDAERAIVELDDAAIGRLCVDRRPDALHVVDIGLLPEHRGRGVGGRLLGSLLDEARQRGVPVRLHVTRGNPARRLYERLGFRRVGITEVHDLLEWRSA